MNPMSCLALPLAKLLIAFIYRDKADSCDAGYDSRNPETQLTITLLAITLKAQDEADTMSLAAVLGTRDTQRLALTDPGQLPCQCQLQRQHHCLVWRSCNQLLVFQTVLLPLPAEMTMQGRHLLTLAHSLVSASCKGAIAASAGSLAGAVTGTIA